VNAWQTVLFAADQTPTGREENSDPRQQRNSGRLRHANLAAADIVIIALASTATKTSQPDCSFAMHQDQERWCSSISDGRC
jgi:hypothetical protein